MIHEVPLDKVAYTVTSFREMELSHKEHAPVCYYGLLQAEVGEQFYLIHLNIEQVFIVSDDYYRIHRKFDFIWVPKCESLLPKKFCDIIIRYVLLLICIHVWICNNLYFITCDLINLTGEYIL